MLALEEKVVVEELKKEINVSVLQQKPGFLKLSLSFDRTKLIKLFEFFLRNGFLSKQEHIFRLIDRPDLLAGQIISFYNKQKKFRIDVELE